MRETVGQIMRGVPIKEGTKAKRVANNTVRYTRPDGAEVWRLHQTDIVVKRPDGSYELNSGGWRTSTTKERINSYSPVRLHQAKGEWFVSIRERDSFTHPNFTSVPFVDGMRVDAEGKPIGYKIDKANAKVKERSGLARRINRFAALIMDEGKYPAIPMPDHGDCWLCWIERPEKAPSGKGWNCNNDPDTIPGKGVDHLLSHLSESYLHGSLIFNAIAWAGYSDPFFMMHTRYRDHMRRALRRYLRRRLGLG